MESNVAAPAAASVPTADSSSGQTPPHVLPFAASDDDDSDDEAAEEGVELGFVDSVEEPLDMAPECFPSKVGGKPVRVVAVMCGGVSRCM